MKMMDNKKSVVCLGIMVADVVGRPVKSFPDTGKLVLVDDMRLHTGGCAVNAAIGLARLGIPVEVIGKVGRDAFGDFLLTQLERYKVGTTGVRRDPTTGTSATMVMVHPDGERSFVHYLGANAKLFLGDIDFGQIERSAILHFAGFFVLPGLDGQPTVALLKKTRAAGVTIFLDTVWDASGRWIELLAPCLPLIDYFVPSLGEAQKLTGLDRPEDVGRALLDRGVGVVALKMGAEGCLVMTGKGEKIRIPAFRVSVVDATGAGDAFAAGFIAGVWHDWPLEQTARLANAVGALCVTEAGASGGIRSLPETLEFMKSNINI
jgi:sugar/nucleoside kinase (ribokinase family)